MASYEKVGKGIGRVVLIGVGGYVGFKLLDALARRYKVTQWINENVGGQPETEGETTDGFDPNVMVGYDASIRSMMN